MQFPTPSSPFETRDRLPRYIFLDPDLIDAVSRVFNPNEYENPMQKGIASCADRYQVALVYAAATVAEIRRYRAAGFATDLAFINRSLPLKRDAFCELNCPNVRANFESLLFAGKSLLDVLCRHLMSPKIGQKLDGFHKGKRDDSVVVGGRVLNALSKSVSLLKLPTRDRLLDLIDKHKAIWIDDLVEMRDTITHTGELRNIIGFWTLIQGKRAAPYTVIDIRDPLLQLSGRTEQLETYCQQLMIQIRDFSTSFQDLLFPPEDRAAALARIHE